MNRARLTDRLLYTLVLLTLLSLAAALLLIFHSFGGGHGRYDLAIFLLGLPSSLILPLIPEVLLANHSDFFNVVALPWLLNSILALTLYFAARPFCSPPAEKR